MREGLRDIMGQHKERRSMERGGMAWSALPHWPLRGREAAKGRPLGGTTTHREGDPEDGQSARKGAGA